MAWYQNLPNPWDWELVELGTVCLCTQQWVIMALFNKVDGLCQGKF